MLSPLAIQRPAKRKRRRTFTPWGLCVHTSGRGIHRQARKRGLTHIEAALRWYRAYARSGVHYVCGADGQLYQMLADNIRGAHVGMWSIRRTAAQQRRRYLSGKWEQDVSRRALMLWRHRWSHYRTPQHLFPGKYPNDSFLGIELVPLAVRRPNGLWFTDAQHVTVRELFLDLKKRHDWNRARSRLVSHGDLTPHSRWDESGSWDVGAMRSRPRFDWTRITP